MNRGYDRDTIERVARIYKSNQDACLALGITLRSFGRLCNKYDVETPYVKRQRQTRAARPQLPEGWLADAAYGLANPATSSRHRRVLFQSHNNINNNVLQNGFGLERTTGTHLANRSA